MRHIIVLAALLGISLAFPDATGKEAAVIKEPLVTLTLGQVRGSLLTSRLGKAIYAFRGIRYAKPPIEDLRFKVIKRIKWII